MPKGTKTKRKVNMEKEIKNLVNKYGIKKMKIKILKDGNIKVKSRCGDKWKQNT